MVLLNEYRVTPEGNWLIIDAQINPDTPNAEIAEIVLSTGGKTPSSWENQINTMLATALNEPGANKHFRYAVELGGVNKPFAILIHIDPKDTDVTTCKYKTMLSAITFNKFPLYEAIACAANDLDGCNSPQYMVDYLLHLKALEASIALGDMDKVVEYFNWFIGDKVNSTKFVKPCGCNR